MKNFRQKVTDTDFAKQFKIWCVVFVAVIVIGGIASYRTTRTQLNEIVAIHAAQENQKQAEEANYYQEKTSGTLNDNSSDAQSDKTAKHKDIHNKEEINNDYEESYKNDFDNEDAEILSAITPFSNSSKIIIAITAAALILLAIWYWMIVACWLYQVAQKADFLSMFWFVLAIFTNIVAVILYNIAKHLAAHCMSCGHIQLTGKYCSKCGKEMKQKCKQCGAALKHGSQYCKNCGEKQ